MKLTIHWLLIFCCGLFAGCHSKPESKSISNSKKAYEVAESNLLVQYQSDDVAVAKKALLDYRQIVITTKGFDGYVDVEKSLYLSDARLMMLCEFTGSTNEAVEWYASYLSNLNIVRTREGQSYYRPSVDEVIRTFTKLDKNMTIRWRATLEHITNN